MSVNIFTTAINTANYFIVKYYLKGNTSLKHAAWNLAIGQSIGNPNNRSVWETDKMFHDHSCFILADEKELESTTDGTVQIAFPIANIDFEEDGISQILCYIAGGQVDISEIQECHILDIHFPPNFESKFKLLPAFGITGFRERVNVYNKPFLGGIVKPKIGMSPEILLEAIKEMVHGGIDFIKEDELLGNPSHCSLQKRVPLISNWLYKHAPNVMYTFCINGDAPHVLNRAAFVAESGGTGIHVNVWSGLGIYRSIRKQNPELWIHFQKSGDKFFTDPRAPFHIYWPVLCKLAGLSGVDSIHAGMIDGYMNQSMQELLDVLEITNQYNIVPALSCGMHPGLVQYINNTINTTDWMANVGGAIHGHPMGTLAGGLAMRQSIDGEITKPEYMAAITKWGIK